MTRTPPEEFDTVVASRRMIAEDVLRVDIARVDGADFPEWSAGAHIDVVLPLGIERQYSLCGPIDDRSVWTICILRESAGRGGSEWFHSSLEEGARLRVRGPSNHFGLEPASGYRFVAGGIGITPIAAMIRSAQSAGLPWRLDYAGRSAARMAFLDDIRALDPERVTTHIAADGERLDLESVRPAPGELVYACGPAGLLDALAAVSRQWDPSVLHLERFEAVHPAHVADDTAFEVDLILSGQTLPVEADESILDVVERAGVFVLSSCREGTCGTCETVVLDGVVDHRDAILTEGERRNNDRMMICVSRAGSPRLELEL